MQGVISSVIHDLPSVRPRTDKSLAVGGRAGGAEELKKKEKAKEQTIQKEK